MAVDRRRALQVGSLAVLIAALLSLLGAERAAAQAGGELVGTFRFAAGRCASGVSGSYFRMILPTGDQQGPWVDNADSGCADHTYTPLTPGTDGGLVTGGYQPAPNPGFDEDGNSRATRLMRPVRFFGVDFSGSTNPSDLQTKQQVPAPTLRSEGGRLGGDLSAFAATWNDQSFNQGSPKPGGGRPGNTTLPTGTYDPATGAFSLTWTSQIVGGPFNNFTGLWHLEGTFVPKGASAPGAAEGGTAGAAPTAGGTGGTATTVAAPAPAPGATVAPGDQPSDDRAEAAPIATTVVDDEGFEPAAWLVVLLALVGIGGVIALLVLGPRARSVT
jgi:hypothetical protein